MPVHRPEKHERCNVDTDTEKRWQSKRKRNAYRKCEVVTPFAFEPAATVIGAADT